ncbi:hypothetical protein [Stenotrophomonas sp.]|uniref:toxin-antitoxin system YwqK family antitoxin n=1 Tax=Stenotrophomonas sp. TaxID=69392 RepID=UPI0028AD9E9C|nr:hypothetical protein [Stenotrophomonas sp.]
MKGTKYVSAVAVALLLVGCSKPVLDWRNAEVNNGLVYATGENEPFTGNVTNIPREQLRRPIAAIENVVNSMPHPIPTQGYNAHWRPLAGLKVHCQVEFDQGKLVGDLSCTYDENGERALETRVVNGSLDGKLELYSVSGYPYMEVPITKGKIDGTARGWFDGGQQKTMFEIGYKNGKLEGPSKVFYEDGSPAVVSTFSEGQQEGEQLAYYPNGKISARVVGSGGVISEEKYFTEEGEQYLNYTQFEAMYAKYDRTDEPITAEEDALFAAALKKYGVARPVRPAEAAAFAAARAAAQEAEHRQWLEQRQQQLQGSH